MQKNVSMRVATFILFEMSLVYHTQCYDFTHATFLLHAIEQRPLEIKLLKSRKNKIITNNKTTKISNGRRMRIFAGFSSEQSIPIFKSSIKKTSRFYQKLFRVNFHPDKIYELRLEQTQTVS